MRVPFILAAAAIAVCLQGCATTTGGQPIFDINAALNSVRNAVLPDSVAAHKAATDVDFKILQTAIDTLKPEDAGQPSSTTGTATEAIQFVRGQLLWNATVVKEARFALPADAVQARHHAVIDALSKFATYAEHRVDSDVTRIYVTAPDAASREWLAEQLKKAGARSVVEVAASYVAVGFSTPGLVKVRQVN